MERPAARELQGADALRRFQGLLLDRRGRLHGQLLRLREVHCLTPCLLYHCLTACPIHPALHSIWK